LRRQAEHLVLAGPFNRHVTEARHAYSVREPAINGRLDEVGRQEGKRDRHVDLAIAAAFALSDTFSAAAYSRYSREAVFLLLRHFAKYLLLARFEVCGVSKYALPAKVSAQPARNHLVCAIPGGPVAGEEQHKLIGNVKSKGIDPYTTTGNIGNEAVARWIALPELDLRQTLGSAATGVFPQPQARA
jgi:hypothetical protein